MSAPPELMHLFRAAWGPSFPALLDESPWNAPEEARIQAALPLLEGCPGHVQALSAALRSWLWSRNQFLELSDADDAELRTSLQRALGALSQQPTRAAVAPALSRHRNELAAFVQRRDPREVVCSEYSPELQLSLLGLSVEQLRAPVLDIGCGPNASLVAHLRAHGIEADGLDRELAPDLGTTGDWLRYPYAPGSLGTALSHLGFSLHFLHHHLAGHELAFQYARAYMAILRALAPGGRFVYTPGLPFLEDMLDRAVYRVRRIKFAGELRVQSLRQIEAASGLSLSHATHVERVA